MAFFESLILFQTPSRFSEQFNEYLCQQEISIISSIASSDAMKTQGMTVTEKEVFCEKKSDIPSMLAAMHKDISKELVQEPNINIALILSNYGHATSLVFSSEGWIFCDINEWPIHIMGNKEIARCNLNFLSDEAASSTTEFSMQLMHTSSNQKLNDMLEKYTYSKKLDKTRFSPNKINSRLLHMASLCGDNKLLTKLINLGIDINLLDDSGSSPLGIAIAHGNDECALTLIENGACIVEKINYPLLLLAIERGNTKTAKYLIERGENTDECSKRRFPSLSIAIKQKNTEIIKSLIENGTSVHATIDGQISPLCSAAKYGNIEIMQLLLNAGANIDDTCLDGVTALLSAVKAGNIEMVQFLLDRGANVNLSNPTLWACMWGHSEIVKALLLKNANYEKVFSGPVKDIKKLFEKHNQEIQSRMQAHIQNLQDNQLIKLTLKNIAHIMGDHDIVSILEQFEDANSIFSLVLQYPLATTGFVAVAATSIIAICATILSLSIPTIIAASACSAVLVGAIGFFAYQNIEEPNKPLETAEAFVKL